MSRFSRRQPGEKRRGAPGCVHLPKAAVGRIPVSGRSENDSVIARPETSSNSAGGGAKRLGTAVILDLLELTLRKKRDGAAVRRPDRRSVGAVRSSQGTRFRGFH